MAAEYIKECGDDLTEWRSRRVVVHLILSLVEAQHVSQLLWKRSRWGSILEKRQGQKVQVTCRQIMDRPGLLLLQRG
jgi:hypothetical protein